MNTHTYTQKNTPEWVFLCFANLSLYTGKKPVSIINITRHRYYETCTINTPANEMGFESNYWCPTMSANFDYETGPSISTYCTDFLFPADNGCQDHYEPVPNIFNLIFVVDKNKTCLEFSPSRSGTGASALPVSLRPPLTPRIAASRKGPTLPALGATRSSKDLQTFLPSRLALCLTTRTGSFTG